MPFDRVLIFIFCLFIAKGNALAAPSSTIRFPNDKALSVYRWRLDSFVFFTLDKRSSDGAPWPPLIDEGITYGLFNSGVVQGEIGMDWWEPEPQDNLQSPHAHFKITVVEKDDFPSLVLGVYAYGFKPNTTDLDILYFGIGKTFDVIGHIFAGYYVGNSLVLIDENGNPANRGFLLSSATPIPSLSKKFSVELDFQSGTSSVSALSFGAKWELSKDTGLLLGYDFFLNHRLARDTVTVQVGVAL